MRLRAFLFAVSLLMVSAAQAQPQAQQIVAVYDVDTAYREEAVQVLRGLFPHDARLPPHALVQIRVLPTGQVAVNATPEQQEQIAAALQAISRADPPATPSITLRYWVLFGEVGQERAPEWPDALADVVRQLQATHGNIDFRVMDTATLTSEAGRRADLNSPARDFEIRQTLYPNGATLNADVEIDHPLIDVTVRASLERGQFLVLGESSAIERPPFLVVDPEGNATNEGDRGIAALVVHWPAE